MALLPVFDGTIAPGTEATNGPGPAPHPALIARACRACCATATTYDGRETGPYWCPQCWPDLRRLTA